MVTGAYQIIVEIGSEDLTQLDEIVTDESAGVHRNGICLVVVGKNTSHTEFIKEEKIS